MNRSPRDMYALIWPSYYPDEQLHSQDPRLGIVEIFHSFLASSEQNFRTVVSHSWDCCYVDVQKLAPLLPFPDFESSLVLRPVEITKTLGMALSAVYWEQNPYVDSPRSVTPRFYNLGQSTPYGQIKASSVGQLVCLEGHVTRVGGTRPLVTSGHFKCAKCGQSAPVKFEDGIFEPPSQCSTHKCYNKFLDFDRDSVELVDVQRVRLTEVEDPSSMLSEENRVPRILDLELRDQLVNTVIAGDHIQVTAIVKSIQQEVGRGQRYGGAKGYQESGLHQLYLLATSIVCLKSSTDRPRLASASITIGNSLAFLLDSTLSAESMRSSFHSMPTTIAGNQCLEFSLSELSSIRSLALSDLALPALVNALCPTIFGQELVKAGLLLALFGGSAQHSSTAGHDSESSGSTLSGSGGGGGGGSCSMRGWSVRSNIHLLIVGDPGLGKSQLLRAAATVAPRAVLIGGNTSTTAGLTVTISREGMSGEVCIEAGALILADQGCCFIDELDKLTCDTHALLEAMEQQSISIAKAGVVTSLRSRASVIAAANPAAGHYNRRKSVCENLKMSSALLSRFDLIFILVDRPDQGQDELISEHIFGLNNPNVNRKRALESLGIAQGEDSAAHLTFHQKLRRTVREVQQSVQQGRMDVNITTEHIRRYIEYARRYVHPTLSKGAAKVLQKQYLTMRSSRDGKDALPVTTRHLESLIRLAQARARVDLREEVTERDAEEVVALLQECILDSLLDDIGRLDMTRKGGMSLAKQMKALVTLLQREARQRGSNMFHRNDIQALSDRLRLDKDVDSLIESMRTECYLLLKGPKMYQLQTS